MKFSVKLLSILAMLVMLVTLAVGCNDNTGDPSLGKDGASFKRLASVTVTDEGETDTYIAQWSENSCRIVGKETLIATYDPESRIFSLQMDDFSIPVFDYDESGKIINLYNEDDPDEKWAITYDENMWPAIADYDGLYTIVDANARIIKRSSGGGGESDENGNRTTYRNYDVRTLDKNGNVIKVDRITETYVNDGEPTESTKADIEKYTYDESGNVIKFQRGDLTVQFTYTNEKIQHNWERTLAIYYINPFYIFELPLFWGIK